MPAAARGAREAGGADGSGGRGPSLQGLADNQPDRQATVDQVVNGEQGMPAFGARLSEPEIDAVVDYVRTAFPAAA